MAHQALEVMTATHHKTKPDPETLQFGKTFTDHMFIMDYSSENGWHSPRIIPYQPLTLDPAAMIYHYGQTVFEGLKAYRTDDDRILLFRPDENFKRLNRSSDRLSIPDIDEKMVLEYLSELLKLDKDWIPTYEGTSLYIRPFIIATEPNLSVAPSTTYKFMIILSPVGSYYKEGIAPVGIYVEDEYTRAALGGTGMAKTAGNYSAAYKAQDKATAHGQAQVLWLDSSEKKYVEEVGSMNVFFKIDGEIITPSLSGSILEGITRKSIIELLKSWGEQVTERRISIDEILNAVREGRLEEAFGTGTAAVISPIGELSWKGEKTLINQRETGSLSRKLYETLTGIQKGRIEDPLHWTYEVK
ncbi:branched-chain amino acid aminotransferase [Alkalicoccobacillus porphyridii]|uniref:Branched-chain-amino-acid aminotransferase n=1 Tax=Alkalicoccobacillus porphyridii TaxID=2597270 RepID=A0A554A070_9BACI|nr:branched-chain amino acid aminotransferase [Alkalicoccobacillus porphyridii]TSB47091.1 branched-chain amino acid aminotransferase [Alkalicoccobacillus porphyridii]